MGQSLSFTQHIKKEVMLFRHSAHSGPVGSHRTDPPQGRTGVACNQAFSG